MEYFWIFIIGASIGSFLNVLADRLPKGESIVAGRSHCDHCRKRLAALDLIPVFSYIILLGKCRYCRKSISLKYPLAEIITGLGFVFIYKYLDIFSLPSPSWVSYIYLVFIFSVAFVLIAADMRYFLIVDTVLYPAIAVSVLYNLLYRSNSIISYAIAAFGAALFLYVLHIATRGKGMGFGDVKLAIFLGFLLGYPDIVVSFYIAFISGALFGVVLLILRKVKFGGRIPFAPFLLVSAMATLVFREELVLLFFRLLYSPSL